ncbi:collagen-like protein mcl1 [Seiridium cupressi]
MKTTVTISTALALLTARPAIAQDPDTDYLNSVCSPEGDFTSGSIPPCIDVVNIEAACAPNGTSTLDLEAHAQCMCLFDHDGLSERNLTSYKEVVSSVSNLLCTGTPTAAFQTLFESVAAAATVPTTGGTTLSDLASGNTAVSVYYTASGSQGPGQITGSATAATATGSVTTDAASTTGKTTSGATGGGSKTTAASSTKTPSTSSSSNVAAPTRMATGSSFLFVMAGGALMAAL